MINGTCKRFFVYLLLGPFAVPWRGLLPRRRLEVTVAFVGPKQVLRLQVLREEVGQGKATPKLLPKTAPVIRWLDVIDRRCIALSQMKTTATN
jgi:hypothetical protein